MTQNILLVIATASELTPFLGHFQFEYHTEFIKRACYKHTSIDVLITSVGMVATACKLTRTLCDNKYDFVINAGICGAYSQRVAPGTVVHIAEDCFVELGTEDSEGVKPLYIRESDKDFFVPQTVVNKNEIKIKSIQNLLRVKGATTHTVTRSEKRNKMITGQYDTQTESMEGAAFLYVCNEFNIPCAQIRSVSNYAGCPADKNWYFDLAASNLCKTITGIVDEICG